ncbi:hypothetical protein BN14_05759 [Rhizoctonia solani AG-1 IB]|uniref:Uncharacterized protein n=1 Tax=Thanatephorus cucumeris (strain AG1-IB / isolate 7/3/14) TaxID=1108050 RepID=M5BYP0_THACB|nr:hypothetical protein BN14_05759 [Rhizoctonia solani AG-1 IB]
MALPHVMVHADAGTSASINSNANDHPTQESLPHGPSGSNLTSAEARPFNSNEFGAIMRLRKRLDLVDEHAQEIRAAQRALLKEEQSLARERDEILRCLSSIGVTVLTTTALYTDDSSRLITPDDNENSPIERTEFEPPKRKRQDASGK